MYYRFLLCIKHCAYVEAFRSLLRKLRVNSVGEAGGEQSAWPCGRSLWGLTRWGLGDRRPAAHPPVPVRSALGPGALDVPEGRRPSGLPAGGWCRQSGMGGRRRPGGGRADIRDCVLSRNLRRPSCSGPAGVWSLGETPWKIKETAILLLCVCPRAKAGVFVGVTLKHTGSEWWFTETLM